MIKTDFNFFITSDEQKKVSEAVKEAEKETSGEIVPIIVKSSSTTSHCYPLLFFFLMAATYLSPLGLDFLNHWGDFFSPLPEIFLLAVASFYIAKFPSAQRLLTPKKDQESQCEQRALLEFYINNIYDTKDKTGILLFTSLLERKIILLADEGIDEKVPKNTWTQLVTQLESRIKKRQVADGYIEAINACKEVLKTHFPIQPDDTNELKNDLVLKD